MTLFYLLEPEEVAIEGSCADYLKLAEIVKIGGRIEANTSANPFPYDSLLDAINVNIRSHSNVSVQVKMAELIIEGRAELLGVLSENISEYGVEAIKADASYHLHIEFFEGHYFLSEDSVPLILEHG